MTTFAHPRTYLCDSYRPLGKLDWSIPKTPINDVLGDLVELPDGAGWTAQIVINDALHRVRGGGKTSGPRSMALFGKEPGVYVEPVHNAAPFGIIAEMVALSEAPLPCPLDSLVVVRVGYHPEEIPGWDELGFGDG